MNGTLLLVDDEEKLLDMTKKFLEREGFQVITAKSGPEALRLVPVHRPDLVILDWMLPGMSGLDICRELRKISSVAIIMLTARSDETDKIVGLEMGADDYLTKPFSLRELSARIRSVLRRTTASNQPDESPLLERGELSIDAAKFRVWKQGEEIILTPTEFKILLTLATSPGIVYSRLQLLRAAMDEEYLNYERTIDTHISHLRKKIETDINNPVYIETVYGVGYRFGEPS